MTRPARILLEGRPGVGKTTLVRRLVGLLQTSGIEPSGFITGEIREFGRRVGFSVEDLEGGCGTLAHVTLPGPPRVGRYGVDLPAFERVALPALRGAGGGIVVIDELGKMELASGAFREAVTALLERDVRLVATVHVYADPFTDCLKRAPGIERIRVDERNRDELPGSLARRLGSA